MPTPWLRTCCRRVDVIYEVLRGRIYLFCNISQPAQPSVITGEPCRAQPNPTLTSYLPMRAYASWTL